MMEVTQTMARIGGGGEEAVSESAVSRSNRWWAGAVLYREKIISA